MNTDLLVFYIIALFLLIVFLRSKYIQWLKKTHWFDWYGNIYLKSWHWKMFRAKMLWLRGGKCERCGSRKRLQVHHLSYRHLWRERLKDVKVLCKKCHDWEHVR